MSTLFHVSEGDDFIEMSRSINFEAEGQQCVNVTVVMDMILESGEQFVAVLRSQDSAVKLGSSSALVTIMDSNSNICLTRCCFRLVVTLQ